MKPLIFALFMLLLLCNYAQAQSNAPTSAPVYPPGTFFAQGVPCKECHIDCLSAGIFSSCRKRVYSYGCDVRDYCVSKDSATQREFVAGAMLCMTFNGCTLKAGAGPADWDKVTKEASLISLTRASMNSTVINSKDPMKAFAQEKEQLLTYDKKIQQLENSYILQGVDSMTRAKRAALQLLSLSGTYYVAYALTELMKADSAKWLPYVNSISNSVSTVPTGCLCTEPRSCDCPGKDNQPQGNMGSTYCVGNAASCSGITFPSGFDPLTGQISTPSTSSTSATPTSPVFGIIKLGVAVVNTPQQQETNTVKLVSFAPGTIGARVPVIPVCSVIPELQSVDWKQIAANSPTRQAYYFNVLKNYVYRYFCALPLNFASYAGVNDVLGSPVDLIKLVEQVATNQPTSFELIHDAILDFVTAYMSVESKLDKKNIVNSAVLAKAKAALLKVAKQLFATTYPCKMYAYETGNRVCNNIGTDDNGLALFRDVMNGACGNENTVDNGAVDAIKGSYASYCTRVKSSGNKMTRAQDEKVLNAYKDIKNYILSAQATSDAYASVFSKLYSKYNKSQVKSAFNIIRQKTRICNNVVYENITPQTTICGYIQAKYLK